MTNVNVNFNTEGSPVRFDSSDSDFEQTLFLGSSVQSFSANVGWNQQQSELTVQLVDDDCIGVGYRPKEYWSSSLTRRVTTLADPGFVGLSNNIIGVPVYFRIADFEFSGLVQSWTENKGTGGNPTYTVKVVDPREILEGTQLIINDYAGGVGNNFNLFNCFGYMEQFGIECPEFHQSSPTVYNPGDAGVDGAMFGTPAGGYAGSQANDNGMQWNKIKSSLNYLLNSVPKATNQFSPYGRVLFRGFSGAIGDGYGVLNSDFLGKSEYFVDISELPVTPSWWRLAGTNVSLMDAINQVTEESGYDYYIELIPIRGVNTFIAGSGIAKMIKVRTVSRVVQPAFGQIANFVNGNEVISSTSGRELRNDVTSAFVVGGPKTTFYQAGDSTNPDGGSTNTITQGGAEVTDNDCPEIDDMILPYFGKDVVTGDFIVPCRTDDENDPNDGNWEFTVNAQRTIDLSLKKINLNFAAVKITENELLMAQSGLEQLLSYWGAVIEANEQDNNRVVGLLATEINDSFIDGERGNLRGAIGALVALKKVKAGDGDQLAVRDLAALGGAEAGDGNPGAQAPGGVPGIDAGSLLFDDIQMVHQWLLEFAEMYGKQFAVRIPFTCVKQDNETGQIITSESPSQDGWTEFSTVLELDNPGVTLDFFRNDTQKIESFVLFNEPEDNNIVFDISELSSDEYISINGADEKLWVKCVVESEFVYHDLSTYFAPRVVVTLPQIVREKVDQVAVDQKGLLGFIKLLFQDVHKIANGDIEIDKIKRNIAGKLMSYFKFEKTLIPSKVGFGLQSSVKTYGPWSKVGVPGKTRMEINDGLVPWEYAGVANMNTAGQGVADQSLTNMQVGEMGSISTHGYPTIPLGAELGAFDGGFFGGGHHLVENRSLSQDSESNDDFNGSSVDTDYGFFSYSDSWTGIYGPNITSIAVNIGTAGVTTDYQLRTFTPKVGRFNKQNADRLKRIGQFRMRAQRNTSQRLLQNRLANDLLKAKAKRNKKPDVPKANQNASPHEVFAGREITVDGPNGDITRTLIATESIPDMMSEVKQDLLSNSYMSFDGLLRPISTADSIYNIDNPELLKDVFTIDVDAFDRGVLKSTLPRWGPIVGIVSPDTNEACNESDFTDGTQQLYGSGYIITDFLNPFSNPVAMVGGPPLGGGNGALTLDDRYGTPNVGHDIDIIGRHDSAEEYNLFESGVSTYIAGQGNLHEGQYHQHYRTFCLKGPLVLQGWGYSTNGRPVPASNPNGSFFADDFLRKPETWPVGPIDLRWDEVRSVWTTAPETLITDAVLCTGAFAEGGTVKARVSAWENNPPRDRQGNSLAGSSAIVNVRTVDDDTNSWPNYFPGDKVRIKYDDTAESWLIIDGPAGTTTYDKVITPIAFGSGNNLSTAEGYGPRTIHFGEGIASSGNEPVANQDPAALVVALERIFTEVQSFPLMTGFEIEGFPATTFDYVSAVDLDLATFQGAANFTDAQNNWAPTVTIKTYSLPALSDANFDVNGRFKDLT